ncbi:MAG: hypothetical protein MI974_13870 [Chitinophagales bacterium]|nr:hypothetical protein [Chitinophagales bacterium]
MKFDLEGKIFQSVENTDNGEVSSDTLFHYHQEENIISAEYSGGCIANGHLLGKINIDGTLRFFYHHINSNGELKVGQCKSTPEILEDGRLKFHEEWQWGTGDNSSGKSVIVEIDSV